MSSARRVLVMAPHCDDETLGVGGTMARHVVEGDEVHVAIVTGHGEHPHPLWLPEYWVALRADAARAMDVLGVPHLHFRELPAAQVADHPVWQVNQAIGSIVEEVGPSVLYVPFRYDLHKDHREVFQAASVAWRPTTSFGRGIAEVYCYEVPSETHWNAPYLEAGFIPNTWVDVSEYLEAKLRALACYTSEIRPAPAARSLEAVRALAVWRGSQQHLAAAEAFVAIHLVR